MASMLRGEGAVFSQGRSLPSVGDLDNRKLQHQLPSQRSGSKEELRHHSTGDNGCPVPASPDFLSLIPPMAGVDLSASHYIPSHRLADVAPWPNDFYSSIGSQFSTVDTDGRFSPSPDSNHLLTNVVERLRACMLLWQHDM